MTIITRRNVLQGLIAAPAIIAIERLMKPKLWVPERPNLIAAPELVATDVTAPEFTLWTNYDGIEACVIGTDPVCHLEIATDAHFRNIVQKREMRMDGNNHMGPLAKGQTYWFRVTDFAGNRSRSLSATMPNPRNPFSSRKTCFLA